MQRARMFASESGSFCASLFIPLLAAAAVITGATPLSAQVPDFVPPNQLRQSQSGIISGQSTQPRACTPADYGDPTAECVPARGQSAYNPYGNLNVAGYGAASRQEPHLPYDDPFYPATDTPLLRPANPSSNYSMPAQSPVYFDKEAPTEFQRYVAASIGKILPLFGASLFEKVPATFAPLDRVPVGADYLIAPGDELQISVWGQLNLSRRAFVDRTGIVTLPGIGPITLAGLTYPQAADAVKVGLSHLYKGFEVSVALGRLHSIQIFVLGNARRPGSYTVSSLSTLVNAIFASGGPSARGSMRSIQLKRGNTVIRDFDLYDLLLSGDKSKDAQLAPGDVIFIPPAGPRVALAGSVENPAIYEIKPGTTLHEVLNLADGPSPLASFKSIRLERIDANANLHALDISLNQNGLKTQLQNGDVIRVMPLVPKFDNAITLKGNVADAGRFPWKKGMRLSDLIPDKESLLTRDYWNQHNALVTPVMASSENNTSGLNNQSPSMSTDAAQHTGPNFKPTTATSFQEQQRNARGDSSLAAATELDDTPPLRTFKPVNDVQPIAPEIDWHYAVLERLDRST